MNLIATCRLVWKLSNCSNSDRWFRLIDTVLLSVIMRRSTPKWNPVHLHTCLSLELIMRPHRILSLRNNSSDTLLGLIKFMLIFAAAGKKYTYPFSSFWLTLSTFFHCCSTTGFIQDLGMILSLRISTMSSWWEIKFCRRNSWKTGINSRPSLVYK